MLSAVIRNGHSYRAVPLAGQLVHHRSAHPGPLVLGATPLNSPARTLDRDRLLVTRPAGFLFPLAPCVAAGFRSLDRSFLLIVRTSRIFTAHRSSEGSTEFPAFSQIYFRPWVAESPLTTGSRRTMLESNSSISNCFTTF